MGRGFVMNLGLVTRHYHSEALNLDRYGVGATRFLPLGALIVAPGLVLAGAGILPERCVTAWYLAAPGFSHYGYAILLAVVCVALATAFLAGALLRFMLRTDATAHALPAPGTDPITGLADRQAFDAAVARAVSNRARMGVLLLDLDGFRALRGTYGRERAEALLREFAVRLAEVAPAGGTLARLHADEFGLVAPMQDMAALRAFCSDLLRDTMLPHFPAGVSGRLSFSVGAALLPADGDTAESVGSAAQLALNQAKIDGGGVWRVFDAAMAAAARAHRELSAELHEALEAGQFVPYYQPIVNLATSEIEGFEVLARWAHPRRGLLSPDVFIAVAEERRACGQLSLCLLRQVIRDCVSWPRHWHFAFNASPGQLHEVLEFVSDPALMPPHMLHPRRIELEITENALITDMALARAVVKRLHAGGARAALDDFGTGYANFLHLREIPFDRIKIDKNFTQSILTDPRTEACVAAMLTLASSLGVAVTAEGVETIEVARRLVAMGCTHAQGYLYSPPVPAEAVARMDATIPRAIVAA